MTRRFRPADYTFDVPTVGRLAESDAILLKKGS
jgi:hypothetical protein